MNTIPVSEQAEFPGDQEIERRIKSLARWNALAMVVRANKVDTASADISPRTGRRRRCMKWDLIIFSAARTKDFEGDTVYLQGHASPGIYARAFLEGRLSVEQLENFRRELKPGGGLVVLSASVADARLLGISHGFDGPEPDHGDLSGAL